MPNSASAANLDALLEAYALLGLEYAATPRDAQHAYREMARRHHPDRVPASSPEHGRATTRMAAINAAYELVRNAPLRHHPISRGSDPDLGFTQEHTDEALRRARASERVDRVITVAAYAAMCAFLVFLMIPTLHAVGLSYGAAVLVAIAGTAAAMAVRRHMDPLNALDGVATLLRLLLSR